ncbi:hypothetical protein SAMN05661096_04111 [Marivirga sericea]|uniref:Lipoprotein n=1 Tax=Marivirga sericea TaxID=1028 RepID=A0A1X7LKU2_9BACT|nr:hypothetical protein [Marivirga sericea]SMG53872.1 hypothetical protein SAMN05661096_04111 [Marivirga sericea]
MHKLHILYLTLLFVSCSHQEEQNSIQQYFDEQEIKHLELLMNFVRNEITADCKSEYEECISKYFNQYEDLPANASDIDLGISKEKEKELLTKIDKSLFDKIWIYCEGSKATSKKDKRVKIKSLCINSKGKFAELLLSTTKSKDTLQIYGKPFEYLGDYSASMNSLLLKQSERFDFESKREFLLITIHLLTLNYPEETF